METQSTASKNHTHVGHRTYVHNRVISEQHDTEPKYARTRSQRAMDRIRTRSILQGLCLEIKRPELADKIGRCHANLSLITCGIHTPAIIPDVACGFRLCPDCARKRASKLLKKYLPAVVAFPTVSNTKPVHLVLTQAHRKETLREAVKRITAHFKTLRNRKLWNDHFKGGLFAVEFTIGKDGLYHAHLHILAFRTRFIPAQLLKDAWLEITGDSTNLRIDLIKGEMIDGLREVLKYAVKPASVDDFTPVHLRDFLAMKNQRLFGTFGEFQKFARTYEPEPHSLASAGDDLETGIGRPCSECGKDGLYKELFVTRLTGSDYVELLRHRERLHRRE